MHIGRNGATRLVAVVASALLAACGNPVETSTPEKLPDTPIFYVDAAAGSDTNHGRTAKAPFRTLNRAAGAVKPGWTVQVMSGTYTSDGTENRSEERRVGKECRCRGWAEQERKKKGRRR